MKKRKTRRNPKITGAKKYSVPISEWRAFLKYKREKKAKEIRNWKLERYQEQLTKFAFKHRTIKGKRRDRWYTKYHNLRNRLYDEFPKEAYDLTYDALFNAGWEEDICEYMAEWSE